MPTILGPNPPKMHKICPKINPFYITAINNPGYKTNPYNAFDTKIKALDKIDLIQRHRINVNASEWDNI